MPVALVASFFPLFMASLTWCGVSGCSGGGFGRISDPDVPVAVAFLVVAGAIVGLPVGLVPWSRRPWTRWLVAAAITAFACFVGYTLIGP